MNAEHLDTTQEMKACLTGPGHSCGTVYRHLISEMFICGGSSRLSSKSLLSDECIFVVVIMASNGAFYVDLIECDHHGVWDANT